MRTYGLDRWNWSSKAKKWVYVTEKNKRRHYRYQEETPQEFIDLTNQLKTLNEKLMKTEDHDENIKVFKELMELSRKMQTMKDH